MDSENIGAPPNGSLPTPASAPVLGRSLSESFIMDALTRAATNPDYIGDFSKPYALPLIKGRHQDLKSISPDTLASLLTGKYEGEIDSFTIIDCRYPYEYNAGHIKGAKNLYTREELIQEFLGQKAARPGPLGAINHQSEGLPRSNSTPATTNACSGGDHKRQILIFHCEFSSERGPSLYRFLRNKDRDMNRSSYPALHYPEIYVLDGGYKAFFEKYQNLCEPQCYLPMHSEAHKEDMRRFRAKSKTISRGKSIPEYSSVIKRPRPMPTSPFSER